MDKRIINPWTWQDQYGAAEAVGQRLGEAGCRFAGSLLGVSRLAMPELMIEIEATAAK